MMILIAIISLGAIGVVGALLLFWASKKFEVHEDPRIGQVQSVLPGANCGGCGYAGCAGFAKVLAKKIFPNDKDISYTLKQPLVVVCGSLNPITKKQIESVSEVFYSMHENDVASWLRSLQLRNIQLPDFLREEALMIVAERR